MKRIRHESAALSAAARVRYWLLVVLCYGLIGGLVGSSALVENSRIQGNLDAVARERGAVLFNLIELLREWNTRHGSVYVPITEATQPNPDLQHEKRDIVTTDNLHLTMVNPAFMTRQLAELAEQHNGVKYHLTSLMPLRAANRADSWEAETLRLFTETGLKERLAFIDHAPAPVHRYMAPLMVKPECMPCHAEQAYKVGDIRGGLSITMPADKLLAIGREQQRSMLLIHGAAFLVIAGLVHLVMWRTYQHLAHLAHLSGNQERLIAERTEALSGANAQLAHEVAVRKRNEELAQENEARYRSVVESSQDGIVVIDGARIVFANQRVGEMLGYSIDSVIGAEWLDFVCPEERARVAENHARRKRGELAPDHYRVHLLRSNALDGGRVATDIQIAPIVEHGEASLKWVIDIRDMTERLHAERDQKLAAIVFESAAEAIMVTDYENRIIKVNPAFTRITGYTPEDVLGQTPGLLQAGRHDKAFYAEMWRSINETGHWEGEIWNRRKDGQPFVEWLSVTRVQNEEEENASATVNHPEESRFVATFTDITKRKETEDLLRHRASHDILTDLPNRGLFSDRLQLALSQARRYQRNLALLYIDLDRFKAVNDALGHAAGDELLIEAAQRMTACIRESDTLARLGGDEFAAILSDVAGLAEVDEIATRLIAVLAEPFRLSAGKAEISGSIGVAIYPLHGGDSEQLKRNADLALYDVKKNQRNAYRIYSDVLQNPPL